jgi:hypothetical protein
LSYGGKGEEEGREGGREVKLGIEGREWDVVVYTWDWQC